MAGEMEGIKAQLSAIQDELHYIRSRVDEQAKLGYDQRLKSLEETRVPAIERRLDTLWGKVTGIIVLVVAVGGLVVSLLKL